MATNPRKFSEKIALHNQKQQEETSAFDQIMKEVSSVKVPEYPNPQWGRFEPMIPAQPQPIKQQHLSISSSLNYRHGGSLPNVNQMAQHNEKGSQSSRQFYNQSSLSPRQSRNSIGPVKSKARLSDHAPYSSPPGHSMTSSSMSNSGIYSMMPGYGPNIHLSPPMENPNWRRTNSDSALNGLLIPSTVPDSSEESSNNSNDPRDNSYSFGISVLGTGGTSPGNSPLHDHNNGGSSGNSSRTPTTGGEASASHLGLPPPSMSSSLPDLTNFPFNPTLHHDLEDRHLNHSPYGPNSGDGNSMSFSPSSHSPHASPGSNDNHMITQHHHHQPHNSQVQISQSQQTPMLDNPLHVNIPFQNYSPDPNMLSAYRDPQRPSPQNSPSPHYRSSSPLLDGNLSAPSSPIPGAAISQATSNDFFCAQFQQQIAQLSVDDNLNRRKENWHQGVNQDQYFYPMPNTGDTAGVSNQQSPQHQQPHTPQTPTSIPEINISEFFTPGYFDSRSAEQLEQFLATEAGVQAVRETLGPIDMLDFQLLDNNDSLVQLDPQTEDEFRLDRS